MKTHTSKFNPIKSIGDFLWKIFTPLVSGLPHKTIFVKPENKFIIHTKKECLKINSERHYHRPIAKPVVERQTLPREKKKVKTAH